MTISDHAIRRYKSRFGYRTSSRKRIVRMIQRELANDVVKKKKLPGMYGHFEILTSKFRAVCQRNTVITITDLHKKDRSEDKKGMVGIHAHL